jgi:transcriptional regulator with XRE-family HTH domain
MDERVDEALRKQLSAFLLDKRTGLDPQAKHVGYNVRREDRIGQPFTQEEIAEALDVSTPWYDALERGASIRVPAVLLERLAALFGLRDDERATLFRLAIREFAVALTSTSMLLEGPSPRSAYVSAIGSPADIDAAAYELARIRDRYHVGGTPAGAMRPRVAASWERCREFGVDPSRKHAPVRENIDDLRATNERLLRAAHPTTAHLADEFAGTGYVVVVTDAHGHLLDLVADLEVRRVVSRLNFELGGDWSEAAIGTNAIGTAIADRRPFQLLGAEHFCDAPLPFTCTAAPIYAPSTGEIAGVLDISGSYKLMRPHLLGVIMQAALEIEERLALL